MINTNEAIVNIDTDSALESILYNISDDYIQASIEEALKYKFRPYATRMPNIVYLLENKFISIKSVYTGSNQQIIDEKRETLYTNIINQICNYYNLSIVNEIPTEHIYMVTYMLYQILVSEFSERMLAMFSNFVFNNRDSLYHSLSQAQIDDRSAYTKKVYTDPVQIAIYENMTFILDNVASLDFSMEVLLALLADKNASDIICRYIGENRSLYKYHYASYITNLATRTDMITNIKLQFVNLYQSRVAMLDQNEPIINEGEGNK